MKTVFIITFCFSNLYAFWSVAGYKHEFKDLNLKRCKMTFLTGKIKALSVVPEIKVYDGVKVDSKLIKTLRLPLYSKVIQKAIFDGYSSCFTNGPEFQKYIKEIDQFKADMAKMEFEDGTVGYVSKDDFFYTFGLNEELIYKYLKDVKEGWKGNVDSFLKMRMCDKYFHPYLEDYKTKEIKFLGDISEEKLEKESKRDRSNLHWNVLHFQLNISHSVFVYYDRHKSDMSKKGPELNMEYDLMIDEALKETTRKIDGIKDNTKDVRPFDVFRINTYRGFLNYLSFDSMFRYTFNEDPQYYKDSFIKDKNFCDQFKEKKDSKTKNK